MDSRFFFSFEEVMTCCPYCEATHYIPPTNNMKQLGPWQPIGFAVNSTGIYVHILFAQQYQQKDTVSIKEAISAPKVISATFLRND